jgi:hypothetical protein
LEYIVAGEIAACCRDRQVVQVVERRVIVAAGERNGPWAIGKCVGGVYDARIDRSVQQRLAVYRVAVIIKRPQVGWEESKSGGPQNEG